MMRSLFGAALLPMLVLGCNPTDPGADMTPQADPLVRMAHYVDGLTPMDVCIKGENDADFIGPIVKSKLMRSGGVPFAFASDYMSLPADTYTLRFIAGSKTDCTQNIFGSSAFDIKTNPVLAGHRYTVAGMGNSGDGGSWRLVLLEDDNGIFPEQARVRFVHGVSTNRGSLDFGSGAGGSFAGLVTASSYTEAADADGQPYLPMAAVTQATWSMRTTGSSTDLKSVTSKVTLEKGKVYTATWLTYLPGDFELSLCADTAAATNGLLPCQEIR